MKNNRIIVGISGSSGAIYGIKLLQILKKISIESHLIISKASHLTITTETDYTIKQIQDLAHCYYNPQNLAASISSGSFATDAMIIAPCSMKTLAAIANGYEDNLIARAASVAIKEQRKLILMVRETPLHAIHLENMLKLSRIGVAICPPVPAFYNKPESIEEIVHYSVVRLLDLLQLSDHDTIKRWKGMGS